VIFDLLIGILDRVKYLVKYVVTPWRVDGMLMRDCRPLHPSKEAISKALTIGNSMNIIGNIGMLNFNPKKKPINTTLIGG
jgi:hypothetical protein